MTKICQFSFGESDSDVQQDSVSAESDSNSDTSDTDESVVIVDPVTAVTSERHSISDSDPEPRNKYYKCWLRTCAPKQFW
jgi:hypothetical protein